MNLMIANSGIYGMRGSNPDGDYAPAGTLTVELTTLDVPPESLAYGLAIEVGDPIEYNVSVTSDSGDAGSVSLDTEGVPTVTGPYGMYDITATWTNQTTGTPVALDGLAPHDDYAAILAQFNYLPLDADGWTILTPSADSRLIYVSETGNDGTAQDYLLSTLPNVGAWEAPGAVSAYQTIDAAKARLRSGYPDYILFKCDDEFSLTSNFDPLPGRSLSERAVITSYGFGARPHINSTGTAEIRYWGTNGDKQAVVGIKVYPTYRDPDHVDFAGWGNTDGGYGLRLFDDVVGTNSLIIEDCWLEFCERGINTGLSSDLIIRRNIIMNSYNEGAHAQGIFTSEAQHIIEENFFYHNGWYKQAIDPGDPSYPGTSEGEGQATLFNHNMYLNRPRNSLVRNNISIKPSSIHVKTTANSTGGADSITSWDFVGHNNLLIDGEVGFSVGGNTDYNTGARYRDIRISRNVTTQAGLSEQTDRQLGWGDDYQDWEGGYSGQNLWFKNGNANVTNVYSREVAGHCSDFAMTRNIDVDLGGAVDQGSGAGSLSFKAQGTNMTNVLDAHNTISNANTDGKVVQRRELITGVTHRDNKYDSSRPAGEWFNYNGSDTDKAGWDSSTGDTGSITGAITFVDAARTIPTYMASLGQTATLDEFVGKCKLQRRGSWNRDYSARYANAYFRAGYKGTT